MCDCIETANKHLAEFNTKIELPMWTSSGRRPPFVQTMKIDEKKRGKPKMIFASCCPFCGEKYAEPEHSPHGRSPADVETPNLPQNRQADQC